CLPWAFPLNSVNVDISARRPGGAGPAHLARAGGSAGGPSPPASVVVLFGGRGGLGDRQVRAAARDHLDTRPLAAGRDADGLHLFAAVATTVGALLGGALAADLLAKHARLGHLAREQLQRSDG